MSENRPPRSKIVEALADVASQGTYQVKPAQAKQMNAIFEWAAWLINDLEAEEEANVNEELNFAAAIAAEEEETNESE